jgi:hypothetical protein
LHVLSTPPAFILSQDQTLRKCITDTTTPTRKKSRSAAPNSKPAKKDPPPPIGSRKAIIQPIKKQSASKKLGTLLSSQTTDTYRHPTKPAGPGPTTRSAFLRCDNQLRTPAHPLSNHHNRRMSRDTTKKLPPTSTFFGGCKTTGQKAVPVRERKRFTPPNRRANRTTSSNSTPRQATQKTIPPPTPQHKPTTTPRPTEAPKGPRPA